MNGASAPSAWGKSIQESYGRAHQSEPYHGRLKYASSSGRWLVTSLFAVHEQSGGRQQGCIVVPR
jgi:hypothetical protein